MGKDAPGVRKRLVAALVVVLSVGGFGLLAATLFSHAGTSFPAGADPRAHPNDLTSQRGMSISVTLPLGLLSDYYEHGIEHAPPRDPRGVMQRREDFYR